MAPALLPPPTAFSAAESSAIDGPTGAPWALLEQTWSLIAQHAGLDAPVIRAHFHADFPQQSRILQSPEGDVLLHRGPGEWWFRYPDSLACRIASGPAPVIELEHHTGSSLEQFTRLAGPVTAMVMDVCGFYPLHACGLVFGSRMFAVHGRSGSGKSTLAAMLAGSGVPVAGDDLLPLDGSGHVVGVGGSLRVQPIHAPPDRQPLALLPDGRGWYPLPVLPTMPLGALLLLERGPVVQVEPLRGADRLLAVLRSGYLSHMEPSPAPAWHERIVKAAGEVEVLRLVIPDTLDALSGHRDQLIALLESLAR
ncbi:MAG TPA: hypothetical protein VGP80_08030 [Gemmatimonadales bacterium]|nr:hypothetical protein [Gemmatimonadales bacterium]